MSTNENKDQTNEQVTENSELSEEQVAAVSGGITRNDLPQRYAAT